MALDRKKRLYELAWLFFKLGCIGFGGPAVHIAMMEKEVVRKRKWLSKDHFLDLVSATSLIPGPNSTEMTMHIGHERAGWKGLVVAGSCFIIPAVIITAFFALAYERYGSLPEAGPFLYGIKPAIIGVIIALMYSLGRKALKSVELGLIGAGAAVLALLGLNDILVLFGCGFLGMLLRLIRKRDRTIHSLLPLLLLPAGSFSRDSFDWRIFWIFLKVGALLYGSGYVLFAFLDTELVKTGLLGKQQLIDAIAVGQFTPGPVFSSATFIGWQMTGFPGAAAATIAIFLPSFLFVALLNPLLPKLRRSETMSAFLDTVNIVSVALILVVCIEMGIAAINDWRTSAIALCGLTVTARFPKLNTAFIVIGGALAGYILSLI